MMTEIISIGLPSIGSMSIEAEDVPGVSTFKGPFETRRIQLDVFKHKYHAVLVAFLKAVDEGAELDCQWGSILIQPLTSGQRRIARKRGWVQLSISHLEGQSSPTVKCYFLKVGGVLNQFKKGIVDGE